MGLPHHLQTGMTGGPDEAIPLFCSPQEWDQTEEDSADIWDSGKMRFGECIAVNTLLLQQKDIRS